MCQTTARPHSLTAAFDMYEPLLQDQQAAALRPGCSSLPPSIVPLQALHSADLHLITYPHNTTHAQAAGTIQLGCLSIKSMAPTESMIRASALWHTTVNNVDTYGGDINRAIAGSRARPNSGQTAASLLALHRVSNPGTRGEDVIGQDDPVRTCSANRTCTSVAIACTSSKIYQA